jgi:hypothetical protein
MARILNKLRPEEEILCGSVADAEAKLDEIRKERKARRGWSVVEDEDGSYRVSDDQGRLDGIYSIED